MTAIVQEHQMWNTGLMMLMSWWGTSPTFTNSGAEFGAGKEQVCDSLLSHQSLRRTVLYRFHTYRCQRYL